MQPNWICERCGRRAYSGRVSVNYRQALTGFADWSVRHWQCDRSWQSDRYYLDIRDDLSTCELVKDSYRHVAMKTWAGRTNLGDAFGVALNPRRNR